MKKIDVMGFSCPIPVVRTKKFIDENPDEILSVLVETTTSKENVIRLAKSRDYLVKWEKTGDEEFMLLLTPPGVK